MNKIRHIYSENPYQKMWDTFVFFESEPSTKQFLSEIYEKQKLEDSYKFSFQNTSKFIYFIKQAREYFYSAEKSNILVKPLLIYYGMMSLIKAVILTKDPNYPSSTGVLRHGITTRKLKKINYKFHDDEIKIQKEGLLPWFYTLMTNKPIDKIAGNKYKIKELLSLLPDLRESYNRLFKEQIIFPLNVKQKTNSYLELIVSRDILSLYHGDMNKLNLELNGYLKHDQKKYTFEESDPSDYIKIICSNFDINIESERLLENPMIIQDFKGHYYFRPFKETRLLLPEVIIDYMVMYNLGMLCRYDTELWGEIIFSFVSEDMYIINEFLNITLRKFPNLILNALFDEFLIFESN